MRPEPLESTPINIPDKRLSQQDNTIGFPGKKRLVRNTINTCAVCGVIYNSRQDNSLGVI